jgi:hypothetical protein
VATHFPRGLAARTVWRGRHDHRSARRMPLA